MKLHTVSQYLKYNELKAWLLRLLAIEFMFCKNSDVTIIISMIEIRMDDHIGVAVICF